MCNKISRAAGNDTSNGNALADDAIYQTKQRIGKEIGEQRAKDALQKKETRAKAPLIPNRTAALKPAPKTVPKGRPASDNSASTPKTSGAQQVPPMPENIPVPRAEASATTTERTTDSHAPAQTRRPKGPVSFHVRNTPARPATAKPTTNPKGHEKGEGEGDGEREPLSPGLIAPSPRKSKGKGKRTEERAPDMWRHSGKEHKHVVGATTGTKGDGGGSGRQQSDQQDEEEERNEKESSTPNA